MLLRACGEAPAAALEQVWPQALDVAAGGPGGSSIAVLGAALRLCGAAGARGRAAKVLLLAARCVDVGSIATVGAAGSSGHSSSVQLGVEAQQHRRQLRALVEQAMELQLQVGAWGAGGVWGEGVPLHMCGKHCLPATGPKCACVHTHEPMR